MPNAAAMRPPLVSVARSRRLAENVRVGPSQKAALMVLGGWRWRATSHAKATGTAQREDVRRGGYQWFGRIRWLRRPWTVRMIVKMKIRRRWREKRKTKKLLQSFLVLVFWCVWVCLTCHEN